MAKRHAARQQRPAGTLRIIGGRWRGRKITFSESPGLRPTGDRVRETLFNWLATEVVGARCLDLFAGSGALGLEALSRGAAACLFVDAAPAVCSRLEAAIAAIGAGSADVRCGDGPRLLERDAIGPFDVVFLDPPFDSDLLARALSALTSPGLLAADARVYVEYPAASPPLFPAGWELLRQRRAGDVGYALLAVAGD